MSTPEVNTTNLDEALSLSALKYLVHTSTNAPLEELDSLSRAELTALYLDYITQRIDIKNAPLSEA